jgi:ActR/RegA family two-component response regulator
VNAPEASFAAQNVLIVEDGDEYLENIRRFAPGPNYLQAHSGSEALALLAAHEIALVVLDMRFDRVPVSTLLGDIDKACRDHGSVEKAYRHLAHNQGLYILAALREHGHAELPVILAYDFTREPRRFSHLARMHPSLTWLPDQVTADELRARIERLLRATR